MYNVKNSHGASTKRQYEFYNHNLSSLFQYLCIKLVIKKLYELKEGDIIILSYAFKMRQDYLSTSYLDQIYLPSERSERGRYELIQVTCAEIIMSHFEGI